MDGNIVHVDYDRSSWRYMNYERNLPKDDLDCYKIGGAIRQNYDILEPTELVRAVAALMVVNGDLTLSNRRMHATGENMEKSKQL